MGSVRESQDGRAGCGALTLATCEGKREALLRLLERRGIVVAQVDRERIAACADAAALDGWFDRAIEARTAADVFASVSNRPGP